MNQKAITTSTEAVPGDGSSAEPYCIESSLGYQMRKLVNSLTVAIERDVVPLGITDAQWKPLLRLYLQSGTSTVAGLARGCSLDAGAMTRLLDRLEAKNLCRRVRSKEDRRVVEIELTPEGVATAEQIPEMLTRLHAAATSDMSPAEVTQLRQLLARMLVNLQALEAAASGAQPSESPFSAAPFEGAMS